jgi:hypothetical protein
MHGGKTLFAQIMEGFGRRVHRVEDYARRCFAPSTVGPGLPPLVRYPQETSDRLRERCRQSSSYLLPAEVRSCSRGARRLSGYIWHYPSMFVFTKIR